MSKRTRFKCYTWDNGTKKAEHEIVATAAGMQIEMLDGRTVQVFLHSDGTIQLRGWGNVPIKLGNWDRTSLTAMLPFEKATHDENGRLLG